MRSKQNSPLGLLTHLPFLVFFILTCRCKLLSEFPSDYLFPLNWKISSGIYFSANLLATDFLSFHLQKRSSFTLACGSFIRHGIWGRLFLSFSNLERLCHCLPHTGFLINPSIFFFFYHSYLYSRFVYSFFDFQQFNYDLPSVVVFVFVTFDAYWTSWIYRLVGILK